MSCCTILLSCFLTALLSLFPGLWLYFLWQRFSRRRRLRKAVAFFHPYCNAGGGGERVLWLALKTLQEKHPEYDYYVYTGDVDLDHDSVLSKVRRTFKIDLKEPPKFVFLKRRYLLEASMYPVFTLLGQSLGSIVVAFEAMFSLLPDIYIDTMGYSFTYPVFKFLGSCRVTCYVHYPTISTDMLQNVSNFNVGVNNRPLIARSRLLTYVKLAYYVLFAKLYGLVGAVSEVIMVNSSWTRGHIVSLWKTPSKTQLVYPPCNVDLFKALKREDSDKNLVISLAQFRPEKNHGLQLNAFRLFLDKCGDDARKNTKLVIIGSCRCEEDERRVQMLRDQAVQLNIQNEVEFKVGVSFDELLDALKCGTVGLHTMKEEHFGIGIVELMAAGLVVLAHNSGGPKLDIIKPGLTGFLATSAEEYAETLEKIINLSQEEVAEIRKRALQNIERFSDQNFENTFLEVINVVFH